MRRLIVSEGKAVAWKTGDVIGVMLDADKGELSYHKNGKDLGVAFSGIDMVNGLYPAASLEAGESFQVT